jgi:hypothetical protein
MSLANWETNLQAGEVAFDQIAEQLVLHLDHGVLYAAVVRLRLSIKRDAAHQHQSDDDGRRDREDAIVACAQELSAPRHDLAIAIGADGGDGGKQRAAHEPAPLRRQPVATEAA